MMESHIIATSQKESPAPSVLLTSVCRPLGEKYGDAPSVGYELLFGQVTRAQGLFSPRANHIHFSLEYVAENLEAPTTVLQYPSRKELIRELKKGYDYVGVSFILATFHHMKEIVALIREHSPASKIVLGGYGTVLADEVLRPHADFICREEGVGFMRRLLGEPEIPMPYGHPLIVSRLHVFGREVSRTGMVFAGLGCPNGCDFCCTSHFFNRRHIRLLPTGRDIYRVIERYLEIEPGMSIVILDEDFLLNKKRALEFRDCVQSGGTPVSIFAFASVRAISQYTVSQILEMGIDGLWIGYEGTRSGFAKQSGRPVDEVFREFREHGIGILASMIVGLPYQTPEIIEEELSGLLDLKPDFSQFLIYGPTPGTPFFDRIMREGLLHRDLVEDPETYYRKCSGFAAMVAHPTMRPEEIEAAQAGCFEADFRRLGPSIYRSIETWLLGYLKLKDSPNPFLRKKAQRFAAHIRTTYPAFLAGRTFGPTSEARQRIADLEARIHRTLGRPTWSERLQSVAATGLAAWTGLALRLGLFQHPSLIRHTFRMPEESRPARAWHRLTRETPATHAVEVELRPESTVWVQVKGRLALAGAEKLVAELREALRRTEDRLILDLRRLFQAEPRAAERIAEGLKAYRDRIRVVMPLTGEFAALTALFALYK
ncbi:MAG TPA: cobalamin-dependent protein [Candidatus Polarisedimenticolia bacterium]|nr:cobalamin-dependent protein [Candidatus Polarisedimenticolia bacterium]